MNRQICCLKRKDDEVRAYASLVLWKIGLEAKATVPVSAEALEGEDSVVRQEYKRRLGDGG